jgi:hypothetical protein
VQAVRSKFGAEEYPQAMRQLLNLAQKAGVEEYVQEFEEARYSAAVHNPELDETFFVTQFVKGLKGDIQGPVQSQFPVSVDRTAVLALMQQEIHEKHKFKSPKSFQPSKVQNMVTKSDGKGHTGGDPSKEKQVREYRRQNGLCFTCGEKFEPGHAAKCPKRVQVQLNALTVEDMEMVLSDEVLMKLEQEEKAAEEYYQLSLNAISGTAEKGSMRVRALIKKQVMLLLVDSGSSTSFISKGMVARLGLVTQACTPVPVKVVNGDILICDQLVPEVEWWANGHTYKTLMCVLNLAPYDAILGYDWLKAHSPMLCDWENNILDFVDAGVKVQLRGDSTELKEVREISVLQLEKWLRGNDVWACVLLEQLTELPVSPGEQQIQKLLEEYKDVFAKPTELPPSRPFDHHIPLLPNSVPVNARPYNTPLYINLKLKNKSRNYLLRGSLCQV